jgi:toxin-antitoxin system PIN domain toxin
VFVVDTNVFVYASNADCPEHQRCRELVKRWQYSSLPWYATWSILYEYLRIVTHPRVFRFPWSLEEAWSFVDCLFASRGFHLLVETERHRKVASQVFGDLPEVAGNLVHDLHTAVLMREHGISRIYTRDTDFHRFPFVAVIDPLRS